MAASERAPLPDSWLAARVSAFRITTPIGFLGFAPLFAIWVKLHTAAKTHAVAIDFATYRNAGTLFLHATSPYNVEVTQRTVENGTAFVYPPPAAALAAPFSLLPGSVSGAVFLVFVTAAFVAALWLTGVTDWRCYGAAFLWPPVLAGIQTANLTLLLVLGVAVAWRYRSRPMISGIAVALLLVFKLFLWPIALWLLATRRYAASAVAFVTGAILMILTWSVIGFGDVARYPGLVRRFAAIQERDAYTPFAFAARLGVKASAAHVIGYVLAAVICVAVVAAALRLGDYVSFVFAVVACFLVNPVTWLHSFALLAIPIAIARPRFSWVWLAPLATIICPVTTPGVAATVDAFTTGIVIICYLISQRQHTSPFAWREPGRV